MSNLQAGIYGGRIVQNDIKETQPGLPCVELLVRIENDGEVHDVPVAIPLDEKSLFRAKSCLEKIGFDVSTERLSNLTENDYLVGRRVVIEVYAADEEWGDGISGSISLNGGVPRQRLTELQQRLRSA